MLHYLDSFFGSIRIRLVILVLVAIIPAAGLILYQGMRQRDADEENARAQTVQVTQIISEQYVDATERVRQLLGALSSLNFFGSREACNSATAALIQHFHQFLNLGVADLDGNVTCSGLVTTGGPVSVADRPYFQQVLASNDFASGSFQIGRVTGKPSVGFGYPIRDTGGRLSGVLLATLDLTWLDEFLAQVQVPRGSVVTVLDKDGIVLARLPEAGDWIGKPVGDSDFFERVQHGPSGTFEGKGLDSERRLYSFATLGQPENRVYLTFGIPNSVAFASANRNLKGSLAFLALASVIALASAGAFGEAFILRGLRSLGAASRRLARGDLSARSNAVGVTGEIAELARRFDDMAASLEARQTEAWRFEEALAGKVAQLNALYGVFTKITESLSTHEVAQAALEQASELVDAEVVVLRLLREGSLEVAGTVSKKLDAILDLKPVQLGEGMMGGIALTGKTVRFDDHVTDFMSPGQGIGGARSGIALPVMIHGKVLGTLGCWSLRPNSFPTDIEQVLEMLCSQIAAAITAAGARDASEHLARVDALTGLSNRLQLTEDLRGLDLQGANGPWVVAMLDIDHFKQLNDGMGHLFGDLVLSRVAAAIKNELRDDDFIYRFGGEEFLVIAHCSRDEAGQQLAERLRTAVEKTEFEQGQGRPSIRATVSVGVALATDFAATVDQTIALADEALYQAKAAGRNRVEVWSPGLTKNAAA